MNREQSIKYRFFEESDYNFVLLDCRFLATAGHVIHNDKFPIYPFLFFSIYSVTNHNVTT